MNHENQPIEYMNIVQFAAKFGGITTADVDSHIHAGLRSKPQTKTYDRWWNKELKRLQDARDETERAYYDAVKTGKIKNPKDSPRLVKLYQTASGHPDNDSVQAARRLWIKAGQEPFWKD